MLLQFFVLERGKTVNNVRIFILVAVLLIGGLFITVSSASDIIKLNGYIPDFNYDSMADIKKGDFVGGYIANIYDCYAGETTTNTTMGIETSSYTSREYFIMPLINDTDLENDMFISVSVSKQEDRDLMYAICDATYEYMDGNEDVEFPEMGFIAKAQPLDAELQGYLLDWFEETEYFDGGRNEAAAHIIPYDLVLFNTNGVYIGLVFGLIMTAAGIVILFFIFHKKKTQVQDQSTFSPDLTGYSQPANGNMPAPAGTPYTDGQPPAQDNGSYYAPSAAPFPELTQPADADEFFARPVRKQTEPVNSAPPKAPAAPVPEEKPAADYSNGIETNDLDTEKLLYEQEQEAASHVRVIENNNGIETDGLDTEKALYEQEQEAASHVRVIENNSGIETDTLDTEKALYEQEQETASHVRVIENNSGIDTDDLDTERALYEQEQEAASHIRKIEDNAGIDTSDLDMDGLGYFDAAAASDGDEDIFDFTNDLDYEVGDASDIEIT